MNHPTLWSDETGLQDFAKSWIPFENSHFLQYLYMGTMYDSGWGKDCAYGQ